MIRSLSALATASAALLLAAACTSGSGPGPNYSSVSTSPTPASSAPPPTQAPAGSIPATGPDVKPGELAPTPPTAAHSPSQDGALAFVTYYVRTIDWVYATSRPDLLTPFFAQGCATCSDGQAFIEQLVTRGQIIGGRILIKQIGIVANDGRQGARFAVSANLSVDSARVVSTSGATATSFPATPSTTLTEWVKWAGGQWEIVEERYA